MDKTYEKLRELRLARLDEQHRNLLSAIPPLRELGVEGLRNAFQGIGESREKTPGVTMRDVQIPGPNGPVPTRIYTPENHRGPKLGVYVHTHAGGFVSGGGLATWDWLNTMIAARTPCIVVHPDFRLPPENKFPAGLDDCWAVLNWVAQSGAAQGWDAGKIAVGGGCTGGNMAAVLALMARDAGAPRVSLQILESWIANAHGTARSHQEFAEGYGLRHEDNDFVVSNYLADLAQRDDWRVSPEFVKSVEGVAPALITVGEWDILRDEDIAYGERLKQSGVDVAVHVIPNTGHFPNPAYEPDVHGLHIEALAATIGPNAGARDWIARVVNHWGRQAPVAEASAPEPAAAPAKSGATGPDGKWVIKVKTPIGVKTDELEFTTVNGKLTGTQKSPELGVHALDIKMDGGKLSWAVPVTRPMKMTLQFSVQIHGDVMTGSVKAGLLGSAPLNGTRV